MRDPTGAMVGQFQGAHRFLRDEPLGPPNPVYSMTLPRPEIAAIRQRAIEVGEGVIEEIVSIQATSVSDVRFQIPDEYTEKKLSGMWRKPRSSREQTLEEIATWKPHPKQT